MNRFHDVSGSFDVEDMYSDDTGDFEAVSDIEDLSFDDKTIFDLMDDDARNNPETVVLEPPAVSVLDVAAYILEKTATISTMKLQKLVYYSQAWSLVWDEAPLFTENIEAWANGPVVRELFDYHRGMFQISTVLTGNPRLLNQEQRETVDAVLRYYQTKPAQWLIDLTHTEAPWIEARKGMPPLVRGNKIIPLDSIANYYSSLAISENEDNEEPKT